MGSEHARFALFLFLFLQSQPVPILDLHVPWIFGTHLSFFILLILLLLPLLLISSFLPVLTDISLFLFRISGCKTVAGETLPSFSNFYLFEDGRFFDYWTEREGEVVSWIAQALGIGLDGHWSGREIRWGRKKELRTLYSVLLSSFTT
jgi:hypothetical protein